ncbi:hypothetical protein HU200_049653 [Digitaria exilis]|uniref:N-acetyltransferase domain-containing protein n=1 Tax=Digitaria exilis TaxID=1010633 RepID=A0A835AQQ3_9POAL|nr:hypothetical protein HU200_049653 [Digitaria exilis]CAB3499239.1 unnamed protein product [Digitaria exilis]
MAAAEATILDLDLSDERAGLVLEDIERLERVIFPEHASPARCLRDELKRRNSGLIYLPSSAAGEEVVGYAVYTCNTSLCATIIELAGEQHIHVHSSQSPGVNDSAEWIRARNCNFVVAVRESCRRQGHGDALLRAAVERCRGRRVQRVILHVDPARAAAVALYRKAGFQVDATIEGFYAPQRDAYRKFMDLQ